MLLQEGRSNNASSKAAAACGDDDDDEDVDEAAAAAALKQLESTSNSVLDFAAANFLPIGWCGLACLLLHYFCVFPDSVETILLLEAFCPPLFSFFPSLHDTSVGVLLVRTALVTGVAVGLTFPQPGQLMQQWGVSKWTTSAIFVISGELHNCEYFFCTPGFVTIV